MNVRALTIVGVAAMIAVTLGTATTPPTVTPTATPVPPCTCIGDANKDGVVDLADFASVSANYGRPADPVTGLGDADCNGFVNSSDFAAVQEHLHRTCPQGRRHFR